MGETRQSKDKKNKNRPKVDLQPYVSSTMGKLPPAARVQHYVGCNCSLCIT